MLSTESPRHPILKVCLSGSIPGSALHPRTPRLPPSLPVCVTLTLSCWHSPLLHLVSPSLCLSCLCLFLSLTLFLLLCPSVPLLSHRTALRLSRGDRAQVPGCARPSFCGWNPGRLCVCREAGLGQTGTPHCVWGQPDRQQRPVGKGAGGQNGPRAVPLGTPSPFPREKGVVPRISVFDPV